MTTTPNIITTWKRTHSSEAAQRAGHPADQWLCIVQDTSGPWPRVLWVGESKSRLVLTRRRDRVVIGLALAAASAVAHAHAGHGALLAHWHAGDVALVLVGAIAFVAARAALRAYRARIAARIAARNDREAA